MQILGVLLVALGVAGLIWQTAGIFFTELRRLGYERELDQWAEEVPEWR